MCVEAAKALNLSIIRMTGVEADGAKRETGNERKGREKERHRNRKTKTR
jgi:hypothetical protein